MTHRKEDWGPWDPQRGLNPMINVVLFLLPWDGSELGALGPYWASAATPPLASPSHRWTGGFSEGSWGWLRSWEVEPWRVRACTRACTRAAVSALRPATTCGQQKLIREIGSPTPCRPLPVRLQGAGSPQGTCSALWFSWEQPIAGDWAKSVLGTSQPHQRESERAPTSCCGQAETKSGKGDSLCRAKNWSRQRMGSEEKESGEQRGRRKVGVNRQNPLRARKGWKATICFRKSEFSTIQSDKRSSQREQVCSATENANDQGKWIILNWWG